MRGVKLKIMGGGKKEGRKEERKESPTGPDLDVMS